MCRWPVLASVPRAPGRPGPDQLGSACRLWVQGSGGVPRREEKTTVVEGLSQRLFSQVQVPLTPLASARLPLNPRHTYGSAGVLGRSPFARLGGGVLGATGWGQEELGQTEECVKTALGAGLLPDHRRRLPEYLF